MARRSSCNQKIATDGREENSDEIFNFKFPPCSRINKQKEAVKYCVECQGYCCQSCVYTHETFPTLVGHKFFDQSTGLSTDFPVVPTEICSRHNIKILDLYCRTHDVVCCTSCMALEHTSCTGVQLISDFAKTMFKKKDVDELNLTLKEKKSEVEKIKMSRETLLEELKESKTNAFNAIKAYREEMETILQHLETESIKEVEKEFQTMETMLLEEIQISENQLKSLSNAADDIKHPMEIKPSSLYP
ncbi:E3 ubiquitin-protein ligase TRIM33-like [Mercenaria mercenaria]|uniref:E3 ubiquitin-protein ligase TRIM33-like n=1 Tax=Mercenaria mercenaria TaxID=6596 RepID=UPI00234F2E2D|nr:E3 ubiquitin-protein ligase TRIM33-like [Mercenaria mercenaria]